MVSVSSWGKEFSACGCTVYFLLKCAVRVCFKSFQKGIALFCINSVSLSHFVSPGDPLVEDCGWSGSVYGAELSLSGWCGRESRRALLPSVCGGVSARTHWNTTRRIPWALQVKGEITLFNENWCKSATIFLIEMFLGEFRVFLSLHSVI